MRNHDQKHKDMCESVLPSTSRKVARQNRRIAHGVNRSAERDALRGVGRRDHEARLSDAEGRRRREVRQMVWDRRGADKIGSLVRWARVTVERDPYLRAASREEVLAHFAGLLPGNTIGRHALQHIEVGLFGYWFGPAISWEERRARHRAAQEAERARFRAGVVGLMAAGYHRELNDAVRHLRAPQMAAIERAKEHGQRWDRLPLLPLLAGSHAIEAFVADTEDDHEVRAAVDRLVRDLL